jgi:predicted amidohydrolase YtcJ
MPAADIKNLKCELTLFAGRVVYQDPAAPITIKK